MGEAQRSDYRPSGPKCLSPYDGGCDCVFCCIQRFQCTDPSCNNVATYGAFDGPNRLHQTYCDDHGPDPL